MSKYRIGNGSVYEFDKSSNAYVHIYKIAQLEYRSSFNRITSDNVAEAIAEIEEVEFLNSLEERQ